MIIDVYSQGKGEGDGTREMKVTKFYNIPGIHRST